MFYFPQKISIITFGRRVNLLSDTFTTTRLVKNTRTVEVCVSFPFDDRFRTERYNFGCSITLRAFFLCLMKEQIIKLLVFLFLSHFDQEWRKFCQFLKSNFKIVYLNFYFLTEEKLKINKKQGFLSANISSERAFFLAIWLAFRQKRFVSDWVSNYSYYTEWFF